MPVTIRTPHKSKSFANPFVRQQDGYFVASVFVPSESAGAGESGVLLARFALEKCEAEDA